MEPRVIRKKRYEPVDGDWQLRGFNVDEADNGVVVNCDYRLNDKTKKRVEADGKAGLGHVDCYKSAKKVFQDKSEAKTFIIGELDKLWGE
jgi:hypothetical protein